MHRIEPTTLQTTNGEAFPVRRIFCVGKNYADHVAEMGSNPKTTPPLFFTKPADAATQDTAIGYPLGTEDLHYEGELVVALKAGGTHLTDAEVSRAIYGYACGCDLTRRDLQAQARKANQPWDLAKALDQGAVLGPLQPYEGLLQEGRLSTKVNGEQRQDGKLEEMIWSIPELIIRLSTYFELKPGDLIFTGTPAGVGPLNVGDDIEVAIADLPPLRFSLTP